MPTGSCRSPAELVSRLPMQQRLMQIEDYKSPLPNGKYLMRWRGTLSLCRGYQRGLALCWPCDQQKMLGRASLQVCYSHLLAGMPDGVIQLPAG